MGLVYLPTFTIKSIFTYIYHKNQPNVGKYTSPMDPMEVMETFHIYDRPIKDFFMGFNGFNLIMVRGLCFLHKLFSFPEDPCNWYMYRHKIHKSQPFM